MSSLVRRLLWLATCAIFVACASAPAPTPTKKKKKKRSKDRVALKKKKHSKADDEKRDEEEQPDKPAKSEKKVATADEEDEVTISDDDEETTSSAKLKKKKAADREKEKAAEREKEKAAEREREKEAEREKERAKEKEREQEAEREKEAEKAKAKAKKKAEETADEDVASDESEEPAPKGKKKPKVTKAAAKKKKGDVAAKKKKAAEDDTEVVAEEPAEAEVDEPKPEDAQPVKSKRKAEKPAKAATKTAEVDMTGDTGPTIDMEDTGGSSLDNRVDDAPPERRAVAIAVPGVDSESDTEPEDTTPVGSNPRVINERPLTLAKSKLDVQGGLRVGLLTLQPVGGMKTSTTTTGLALGVNYGASENTEIGLDYTAGVSPGSAKGPITLHGAYRAYSTAKLDVAVAAGLAVDFSDVTDPGTMQTTSKTAFSVELGAWARYRVNRKASLFTGLPALPTSTVSLSKLSFALPPLPYQLAIGVNDGGTKALDLPVGFGYQATPKLYAFGMLNLAHLKIADTANAFLFKDFIPLALGGFYALDKLDIGVLFSDDLKQGTDYLRFDTVIRYSIK